MLFIGMSGKTGRSDNIYKINVIVVSGRYCMTRQIGQPPKAYMGIISQPPDASMGMISQPPDASMGMISQLPDARMDIMIMETKASRQMRAWL